MFPITGKYTFFSSTQKIYLPKKKKKDYNLGK